MTTYQLTGLKTQLRFQITYTEGGICEAVKIIEPHTWEATQRLYFFQNILPDLMDELPLKQPKNAFQMVFKIEVLPTDLSFETFWNTYKYKVGRKEKCRELWKMLDDDSKAQAFSGIKKYNTWLILNPKREKLYPETFLSQRRWENDY